MGWSWLRIVRVRGTTIGTGVPNDVVVVDVDVVGICWGAGSPVGLEVTGWG